MARGGLRVVHLRGGAGQAAGFRRENKNSVFVDIHAALLLDLINS
jgi:hypothetical protein